MARLGQTRTIILLIIFCALGAYVLWLPGTTGKSTGDDAVGQALLPVSPDAVTEIIVQYKDQRPELVMRKMDGGWQLVQPKQGKANPDHVRQLLDIFQYGYVEVLNGAGQGLASYGLETPEIVLTLISSINGKSSKAKVMFGQDSPSKAVCYCRVEGAPKIFTVGALYKRELEKSPDYFMRPTE